MGGDDVVEIGAEGLNDVENTVFVAVGKSVKDSKTTLFWATNNFPGKKICLLHVHQTSQLATLVDEKFSIIKVKKMMTKAWREVERRNMHKLLNQYLLILNQLGVQACKVWIEIENVEKGIIQVIAQYNVKRLVMGAAVDEHYTENMLELKSKKSTFVCQQAPDSCHIWFACNGHLIYARCGNGMFHMQGSTIIPSVSSTRDVKLVRVNMDEDRDEQEEMPELTTQNLIHSTQSIEEVVEECENLTEMKRIQELEKASDRQKQELEEMQEQYNKCIKELQMIRDQKPEIECQLMNSKSMEEELEEKVGQAVNLLVTFKEKRDKLQIECDDVSKRNAELRKLVVGDSELQFFEFSFCDINEATKEFDSSMKIGDGRYGSVYKGLLRHRKVAIKMLPSHGCQGDMDFENEVRFLIKMRHPNLVSVIGISPETRSLIYEYLENGSLEDRILCRGKTQPLSWRTRIKIASEICHALIFLHSNKPSIIHGNLKPTNILLDANSVTKISDMGMYRLVPKDFETTYLTSLCNGNDLEASAYVAPEVFETGEVTLKSDVYSFGIVLLRLLTGKPAVGLLENVKCALNMGNFSLVLDSDAGKWPFELTENLARVALKCCEIEMEHRADLVSNLIDELDLMMKLCDSPDLDAKETRRVPSHFLCPIFQEIMKDPQIAPDGFTYEGDAIKGWFNSGHKTSPMTNLKLESCDLLPNYALYYAIQEWEQQN